MAPERPTLAELESRVRQSALTLEGPVPRDTALVWDGYFAALLEWGLISVEDHARLIALLPFVRDNPVMGVFLGWNRDKDPPA